LYFLDTTDELIDDYVQKISCPDTLEGWLNQEVENEEISSLGLVDKVQPAPGVIKMMI